MSWRLWRSNFLKSLVIASGIFLLGASQAFAVPPVGNIEGEWGCVGWRPDVGVFTRYTATGWAANTIVGRDNYGNAPWFYVYATRDNAPNGPLQGWYHPYNFTTPRWDVYYTAINQGWYTIGATEKLGFNLWVEWPGIVTFDLRPNITVYATGLSGPQNFWGSGQRITFGYCS